jgi:glutaminyl-peptide cyclotransferase
MKADYPRFFFSVFVLTILAWALSCSGKSGVREEVPARIQEPTVAEERVDVQMVAPEENTGFRLNEPITVALSLAARSRTPDSIVVSFDSKRVAALTGEPWRYTIPPEYTVRTGRKSIKVTAWRNSKPAASLTRFMIIYADKAPEKYGYRIVRTYPHDREAFTQGLFYHGGTLYEGTGQETGSTLREVELETGRVLRQHNLDASLFGEGITLHNDRIFQVTWENKVGFVYDRATFKVLNRIYYPTQGWGLTTVGNRIVMSDGTNVLYFYEPESFTALSRLEVYDDKNKIDNLNELEFINGEIWANIWMSDQVARIDPETGKVNGYINLAGLLSNNDKLPDTDVLNGIAWDQDGDRIFVTGKRWPKLFEIRITE